MTTWIKEEKSSFLVRALEQLDTPLGEIIEAIERYRHTDIDESELSLSTQKGLRVSLIRRFFSESLDFINVAKNAISGQGFLRPAGQDHLPAALPRQTGRQERRTVPRQEDHRQARRARQPAAAGEGPEDLVHHVRLDSPLRSSQRTGRRAELEVHGDRPGAAGISPPGRAVQEFVVSVGIGEGIVARAGRSGRSSDHRAQLEPARRSRGLGVFRQVQEPLSRQPAARKKSVWRR